MSRLKPHQQQPSLFGDEISIQKTPLSFPTNYASILEKIEHINPNKYTLPLAPSGEL